MYTCENIRLASVCSLNNAKQKGKLFKIRQVISGYLFCSYSIYMDSNETLLCLGKSLAYNLHLFNLTVRTAHFSSELLKFAAEVSVRVHFLYCSLCDYLFLSSQQLHRPLPSLWTSRASSHALNPPSLTDIFVANRFKRTSRWHHKLASPSSSGKNFIGLKTNQTGRKTAFF